MADSERGVIKVLVVARWPLGGIRTYMKYVFRFLPEWYRLTILSSSTQEDAALRADAAELGARLLIDRSPHGNLGLVAAVFRELSQGKYDIILSQGFISAMNVYPVNAAFRVPHILTVHGLLEEKYFQGRSGWIKKRLLSWVVSHVDVLYTVSEDLLAHLEEKLPALAKARCRKVVIPNGINVAQFQVASRGDSGWRQSLGIGRAEFLFGFLGRFMQEKGFKYLIEAAAILDRQVRPGQEFRILAVGSGDYESYYRRVIGERGLGHRFTFLPFQRDISVIYGELDAVVMPSLWEASGLVAMEALCSGVPLLTSDCIGLRETVRGTPAAVFRSKDPVAVAECMARVLVDPARGTYARFAQTACQRYDVRNTSRALEKVIAGLIA
jgi:glycosyltransferase involved in cell wall biosynthesis